MLTIKFSTSSTELVKNRQFNSLHDAQCWALDDIQEYLPFSLLHDIEQPIEIDGLTWQTKFTDDYYLVTCSGAGKIEYHYKFINDSYILPTKES
jgi:hypothetical protein